MALIESRRFAINVRALLGVMFIGVFLQLSLAKKKPKRIFDCADMDANLLCGSNAVTYLNLCDFYEAKLKDRELTIEGSGGCPCSPNEKFDWDPICGTDNQLYANQCELDRARNYLQVGIKHLGLCKELMEREDISYRDLQKVYKWKNFMPRDLFKELTSRPLYENRESKATTTTKKPKKKWKHVGEKGLKGERVKKNKSVLKIYPFF